MKNEFNAPAFAKLLLMLFAVIGLSLSAIGSASAFLSVPVMDRVNSVKGETLVMPEFGQVEAKKIAQNDKSEKPGIMDERLANGKMEHGEMEHGKMEHGEMEHGEMEHGKMEHDEMEHGKMNHDEMEHGKMEHGEMEHGKMDHKKVDK
jgi:uncharacterized protein involved in copper resistance